MADNTNRKPDLADRDVQRDEAELADPLMQLSLIAGFEPDDMPDLSPANDASEGSTQKVSDPAIDLAATLEAELSPVSIEADTIDEALADEPLIGSEEPAEIPNFLSSPDSNPISAEMEPVSDLQAETDFDVPAPEPVLEAWPPAGASTAASEEPDETASGSDETSGEGEEGAIAAGAELIDPAETATDARPTSDPVTAEEAPVAADAPMSLEDELAAILGVDPKELAPRETARASTDDQAAPEVTNIVPFSADRSDKARRDDQAAEAIKPTSAIADLDAAWDSASSTSEAPTDDAIFASTATEAEPSAEIKTPVFGRATPVDPAVRAASSLADSGTIASTSADVSAEPPSDELVPDLDAEFAAAFDDALAGTELDAVEEPKAAAADSIDLQPEVEEAVAAEDTSVSVDATRAVDPVDELAAIMGLRRSDDADGSFTDSADAADEARTFEDMDADFQSALDQELPDLDFSEPAASGTAEEEQAAPQPTIDTVDMSRFDGIDSAGFNVPDLGNQDDDALAESALSNLEDELAGALEVDTETKVAVASAPDHSGGDIEFDTEQFEAQMARDKEYVGHDRETARAAGEVDLDGLGEVAEQPPARSGRRAAMVAMVVAGLAVAGIGGVVALTGGDVAVDEGPVLVEADPEPVKIEPEDPGGATVPNQDRAVFADAETVTPEQENLVSTAEEPVDIASTPVDGLPSAVATAEKSEERLTTGGTESETPAEIAPITPRRVRTLIVRPDGTLEERAPTPAPVVVAERPTLATESEPASGTQPAEDTLAPAATQNEAPIVGAAETVAGLPVDPAAGTEAGEALPEAPVQQATTETDQAAVEADGAVATSASGADGAVADTQVALADTTTGSTQAANPPVVVRRVQTTTATPDVIADRPADQPVNVVNRTQEVASAPVPATPQPAEVAVTTSGNTGGFTVQLAALPSEEAARVTATRLSQQYGSLIAGRGMTIQRAVIEGRGTFYRIRVAADGSGDANGLCNSIKASGGNCFVAR